MSSSLIANGPTLEFFKFISLNLVWYKKVSNIIDDNLVVYSNGKYC